MYSRLTDRVKIAIVFFVHGLMLATWAPHIPYVREELGLSEGALGLLLLFLAAGAVAAMLLTGAVASRIGADVVTKWSTVAMAATLLLPLAAPSALTLAIALIVFGAALGSMDVAMNAVAAEVEADLGRPAMSSFHGMFSVGALGGSLLAAALLRGGVQPFYQAVAVALVVVVATWPILTRLPHGVTSEDEGLAAIRFPKGRLLLLGIIAFAVMLAEGSALDWSATYLSSDLGATAAVAALAYGAFSITMAIGRFTGDAVKRRIGGARLVRIGAAVASIGLGIGLVVATPVSVIIGFAVMGAGLANIIPVIFTASAEQGATPAEGISGTATLGYLGFLAGPPLIGAIAEVTNLTVGLGVVVVLLIVVTASSAALAQKPADSASPRT
ncbi:MAG: MFS transporter [Acidimicrobiia bacterium]